MTAQEIARAISSIAFQKMTQESKSMAEATDDAHVVVEKVMQSASSLAKTYGASSMVLFQQILGQAQYLIGQGRTSDKAIGESADIVEQTLKKALELEKKYQ